jgi:magnesium transporter
VISIFVHRNGQTETASSIDRSLLNPASGACVWVDLAAPSVPDSLVLSDTFAFHPLSVEDAMSAVHHPKVEAYDGYLYVILHGVDLRADTGGFATHDVDFFVGPNYLVTVHDGHSRAIAAVKEHVTRNARIMAEGPVALLHRLADAMIEDYRPELEKLEERLDRLEEAVFRAPRHALVRLILDEKRQVATLRRIVNPQRDVVARLARREFLDISSDMAFRFRDVHDALVGIADDALVFQDRITGLLDAHLSNLNNRLGEVMKLLTVLTTIVLPTTLLAGMYGMNVRLPRFPGGDAAQFWWVAALMVAIVAAMLTVFRLRRWI